MRRITSYSTETGIPITTSCCTRGLAINGWVKCPWQSRLPLSSSVCLFVRLPSASPALPDIHISSVFTKVIPDSRCAPRLATAAAHSCCRFFLFISLLGLLLSFFLSLSLSLFTPTPPLSLPPHPSRTQHTSSLPATARAAGADANTRIRSADRGSVAARTLG